MNEYSDEASVNESEISIVNKLVFFITYFNKTHYWTVFKMYVCMLCMYECMYMCVYIYNI